MLIQNVLNIWIWFVPKHFINVKRIFLLTDKGLYGADINNSLLFYVQYRPRKDTLGCKWLRGSLYQLPVSNEVYFNKQGILTVPKSLSFKYGIWSATTSFSQHILCIQKQITVIIRYVLSGYLILWLKILQWLSNLWGSSFGLKPKTWQSTS